MAALAARGTHAVIPPRRKLHHPRAYDAVRYAQRNPIERLFSCPKQFRRVAMRYNKLNAHLLAFVYVAATVLCMVQAAVSQSKKQVGHLTRKQVALLVGRSSK